MPSRSGFGALEARAAEIRALQKAGVTATAAYAAAFDYLLATLQAEVSWLGRFATVLRVGCSTGRPRVPRLGAETLWGR